LLPVDPKPSPAGQGVFHFFEFAIIAFHYAVNDCGELGALIRLAQQGTVNQRHTFLRQRL
jgi:hypothetical protein